MTVLPDRIACEAFPILNAMISQSGLIDSKAKDRSSRVSVTGVHSGMMVVLDKKKSGVAR